MVLDKKRYNEDIHTGSLLPSDKEVATMTSKGKQQGEGSQSAPAGSRIQHLAGLCQTDFEIEFLGGVLQSCPDYVEVLRLLGNNLTLKRRYLEGLEIDRRLIRLRPQDALAHYNLACSFALLRRTESAIKALQRAVQLGYHDCGYMEKDHDLDSIRRDPRFKKLVRELQKNQ